MRAPQIDLPLQPPAPAVQDAPTRAGRDDGSDFASTLKRSSAEAAQRDQPPEDAVAKPEQPAAKEDKTTTPATAKSATATSDHADKTASDGATAAVPAGAAPSDDQGVLDPALAALLALPAAALLVADDGAMPITADGDPLAALTGPVAAPLPATTTPTANAADPSAADATVVLPVVATSAPVTTTPATAASVPVPPTGLASALVGDAVATADTSDVVSATPSAAMVAPAPLAKNETAAVVPSAAAAPTSEVAATAALPPVTSAQVAAKPVLPHRNDTAVAPSDDEPAPATALPLATPITTATPAAQSTGMHAIAAAIGEHEAKDAKAQETVTATARSIVGDLATPAQATQPTAPASVTKPLSDTVLAQNTLAQQGNAMEKAVSHQVAKALVQQLPNGDRMMVVRLTPPELGTVKIEVVERQGVLSARLHAEDDGVRLALERFLPAMRQELRASDAPIRELNLSDQAQFQRSFADGQQGQQQQDASPSGNRRQRDDAPRFSIDGVRQEPVLVPRSAPLGGRVGPSWVDARA